MEIQCCPFHYNALGRDAALSSSSVSETAMNELTDLTFSPRVVGTQRADFYSLETFLQSPPFKGKQGEALVLAIYDYFTSTVDGTYHFWPTSEEFGVPRTRNVVYDPVKLINAYGWLVCGQHSALLYALYLAAGFKARQIGVPGHSLCEVFYDGRWHILDVDMWTWFRTPEGHIAGAFELAKNARALILDNPTRSTPCNLPDRTLADYSYMYATTETVDDHVRTLCPPFKTQAHTMDFQLRPGETLIRSQAHQGRYHFPPHWKEMQQRYAKEWRGLPHERYEPFRTFGNGRWIYEPNLCAPYRDVDRGVWERSGVTQDNAGLTGTGSISFRIRSPYPFCGTPDWSREPIAYSNGVWLSAAGLGEITAEISDADGQWKSVLTKSGKFDERVDITALLEARYDCVIRFTLKPGARLTRFRFEGCILTAPLSLPRLVEGGNALEVRCLDPHGLRTIPWSHALDFRATADLAQQFVSIENAEIKPYVKGWQQFVPKSGQPLKLTARFAAPAGRTLAWAYVLLNLRELSAGAPPQNATLERSSDGKSWQPLSQTPVSSTELQWDCSFEAEAMTDAARELWLRVTTPSGVSAFEFHGHLNADSPPAAAALQVVHRWIEDDGEHTFAPPPNATRYSISCGKNPRLHTIEMKVGSER
jgi:hypothetical protein